jgi:hypothetical protein
MGEKERAEALLQAAGVSGVRVEPAAEQVTVSRAELDALRAAAVPGAQAPAGIPAQVQQLGAELAAGTTPGTPPGGLPAGILPLEEIQRQEREGSGRPGMSHSERMAANEAFCASAEYHLRNGAA